MIRSFLHTVLRRLNVFSSIRGKITVLLMVIAITVGAAGFGIYQSFDRVSSSMGDMTERDLPQLTRSNDLVMASAATKDAMLAVLMSKNATELTAAKDKVESSLQNLDTVVSNLPEDVRQDFAEDNAAVDQMLENLIAARGTAFDTTQRTATMIGDLQGLVSALQSSLIEIADEAYFNIAMQGEDTITVIEETMLDLVDNKFTALQTLLEVRSEINLLSGVSLALAGTEDSATLSILSDLAVSAENRLTSAMDALSTMEVDPGGREEIREKEEKRDD
ncbi:methyl-accepting chemotaxis protein, partial [Phaeobacter sp. HF9A]|nr:methyl-accepting chemotaxis protein [Phaeobacter sp. HF9A]